jgi:DNA-binding response OmpR family regulator
MSRTRFLLLIDDDVSLCEVVATALEYEGYAVRTAFDAATGLALATEDTALVLLDIRMPGLDPREFARRFREKRGECTPIVVFSASRHAVRFARAINADGILRKPFELDDLLELAARHLGEDRDERLVRNERFA